MRIPLTRSHCNLRRCLQWTEWSHVIRSSLTEDTKRTQQESTFKRHTRLMKTDGLYLLPLLTWHEAALDSCVTECMSVCTGQCRLNAGSNRSSDRAAKFVPCPSSESTAPNLMLAYRYDHESPQSLKSCSLKKPCKGTKFAPESIRHKSTLSGTAQGLKCQHRTFTAE